MFIRQMLKSLTASSFVVLISFVEILERKSYTNCSFRTCGNKNHCDVRSKDLGSKWALIVTSLFFI